MTTSLASEPMPDDGQVPYMSHFVDMLYQRLPEVLRTLDARDSTWTLKRYLGSTLADMGLINDTIDRITGNSPVGPAAPEPGGLPGDDLARWRAARVDHPSELGDPLAADAAWLPWMAQLVGVHLDPSATEAERRDTIRFTTSGYRAGTRQAIADAAGSALTGSKYAAVFVHTTVVSGNLVAGTTWDITIVTRSSETPDPGVVLGAVVRKGVKPAGAVLHHKAYNSTWAQIAALYPTWADWHAAGSWAKIQEAGLT